MASIILSFVGNQDPISENTLEEGSIVTLVRSLLTEKCQIKRLILLYTNDNKERAELTQDWLKDDPLHIPRDIIELIPVSPELSDDPVNLLLAAKEARKGIEKAKSYLTSQDKLEFNSSSGTPVMKSAWNILQAAGYAPQSGVWQVRNPKAMQSGQSRVFQTNVDTLKKEFDIKIIKRQIHDYNYSGALATFTENNLSDPKITALLEYGHYRMASDFNRAFTSVQPFADFVEPQLKREITALRQKKQEALLTEVYFKALIRLKNQEYSDFLVLLFGFQENVLRFLMKREFLPSNQLTQSWKDVERNIMEVMQTYDVGKLKQYLESYRQKDGKLLKRGEYLNRPVMMAVLEYKSEWAELVTSLKKLDRYCDLRNLYVHQLEGVSQIEDEDQVKTNLRKILRQLTTVPTINPFDLLNQQICSYLDNLA